MNKIIDESYFDLIIDNSIIDLYGVASNNQSYTINPKASLMLLDDSQFSMQLLETYPYAFFPSLFTLTSSITETSGIDKVQANPNFSLFGQGVLVGIIDTGIDYQHPAFLYPDKSSRIYSIWDQTIEQGNSPPANLYYGSEYSNDQINLALQSENPIGIVPSTDEIGHGTMIAGIIAGSVEHGEFQGVVPQAELAIVKLKPAKRRNKELFCVPNDLLCYEENDVIAGLTYLTDLAKKLHHPLAICVALGTSQGGHNGKGSTSGYLDYITQSPHLAVATAAGNEANSKRHFLGKIGDSYYTDFELNVGPRDTSFSMEIWVSSPYRISIDITTPTGETSYNLYPRIHECRKLNFIFTPSTIWINNTVSESDTGDQLILLRFSNALNGIWKFRAHSIDHEAITFHSWLPAENLISRDTFFLNSNPETTVTSPGNASSPLTIGNYDFATGNISVDSGRGYTRDNLIKPDLAAPGSNITAPFPGGSYRQLSGTGAAAAHTTGLMAMVLEWAVVKGKYRSITGSDINKLLIRGATRTKQNTYPNPQNGYGNIDIYGLFEKLT